VAYRVITGNVVPDHATIARFVVRHEPGWQGGRYDWMRSVLKTTLGEQLYGKRVQMIEPVFGNTKHNRSVTLAFTTEADKRCGPNGGC
jgi:hypothetical protein